VVLRGIETLCGWTFFCVNFSVCIFGDAWVLSRIVVDGKNSCTAGIIKMYKTSKKNIFGSLGTPLPQSNQIFL